MTGAVALRLGRVSNLPTVWTNVLTGMLLAGGGQADAPAGLLLALLLACSLFYVGGMYLNDAFDAGIDARQRPERPIPAGLVSQRTVALGGGTMLALGLALLLGVGVMPAAGTGLWPALAGLGLTSAILLYDWHHKGNPLSPLLMGLCRLLVYVVAGVAVVVPLPGLLWLAGLLLLCYVAGLTYTAKQESFAAVENLWPLLLLALPALYALQAAVGGPVQALLAVMFLGWLLVALWLMRRRRPGDVPRAVVSLIAGICLFDAVLIASVGATGLAWLAVAGFALTLALQRLVPGT